MWFERSLSGAIAIVVAIGVAGAAEPAKKPGKRRGYDFTRPEPGDILPNPTEAIGTPPLLRAYATVKEMATESGSGKTGKAKPQPTPVDIGTPPPETQAGAASGAAAASPATSSGAPQSSASPQAMATTLVTQHIQKTLASELAAKGLGGRLVYRPSPLAETDPDIRASEERAWTGTVASLATSWALWQQAHPATTPRREAAMPPAAIQRSPGTILLEGAPASVTGDIDAPDL